MNKYEFIEQLDNALVGKVSEKERRETIRYYSNYMDDEMKAGKSEKEVLASLGSPTAIARSIIEAKGYDRDGEAVEQGYEEQEEDRTFVKTKQVSGWKVWAMLGGVLLVLLLIASLVFKVLVAILPFLAVFGIALFIIKLITGR